MSVMAAAGRADEASGHQAHTVELRREAYTMALYVAICLLAAMLALPDSDGTHDHLLGLIWGVTGGLAVAHWFAFRVATRLVGAGRVGRDDLDLAAAQLTGAAAVAVLASIPVVVLPDSFELEVCELLLAAFVALVGFVAMRSGGASKATAFLYALVVLVVGAAVVELKNRLAGH
jgi:hypothetical protein